MVYQHRGSFLFLTSYSKLRSTANATWSDGWAKLGSATLAPSCASDGNGAVLTTRNGCSPPAAPALTKT